MKKLLEKAKEKAKEIVAFLELEPTPENLILAEKLWIKISEEVLGSQWISVDKALPDEFTRVLCMMKDTGEVVSGYITKRYHNYPEVATDSFFHFEDNGGYECTHWMPEPPDTPDVYEPCDLVTWEQARELAKLGFDEPCIYHYYASELSTPRRGFLRSYNSILSLNSLDAPNQAQAGWWLKNREDTLKDIPDCLKPLLQ